MASPWGRGPSTWIWFALFAGALTALLLWLASDRGGLPGDGGSGARIIGGIVLAAAIAAGLVHGRRVGFKGAVGAICAWTAVAALLVLGYSYRFELQDAWRRIAGEIAPDSVVNAGPRSFAIRRANDGHFYIRAEVNGAPIRFLVDTGATKTVLGPKDAARAGIDPARLSFTEPARTANGIVWGAPVTLSRVTIGPVRFRDVKASVNGVALSTSLLGISTLNLFKGWKEENDRLILSY